MGVSTHYGLVSVLRDVNVEIFPGEIVCLLGGNASGKTTTLKTILGYVVPSAGEVRLDLLPEILIGDTRNRRISVSDLELEPIRESGLRQQLLGLGEVLLETEFSSDLLGRAADTDRQ